FHNDGGGDNYGHEFELEYGLTNRFLIELSSELEKESGSGTKFEAVEIGGRYQFTETGEYWVDSGAQLAYIHALHDGDADALEG
ncbi:hypothetical protein ABI118_15675, partial [Enterococcus faecium]|uniref:hypothetical protein n=1 Tax=Enterococcus faecium TaxID=1352 RepID=UPI003F41DC55